MMELITIDEAGNAVLDPFTATRLEGFERQMEILKEKEAEVKQAVFEEMQRKGVIKIETEGMRINYIAAFDREKFNSKSLKKDNPDLYDDYVDITHVRANIQVRN